MSSTRFVLPSVYFTGHTEVNVPEVKRFLADTNNMDFWESWQAAMADGISPAEALCSMYAKLCYNSLSLGKNANVTRVRDIRGNIEGCFDQGHGSVFEHVNFNFIVHNCSRVLTHELVRHRVGTAFSQTSGRYCMPVPDENGELSIDYVHDPILDEVEDDIRAGLEAIIDRYKSATDRMRVAERPMHDKKKITSALRRMLPNGQANDMGVSFNIRTIRHLVQVRTSRFAEWEIRVVFGDVYRALKTKFPLIFHGAVEAEAEGLLEVSGMRMQPYDRRFAPDDVRAIVLDLLSRYKHLSGESLLKAVAEDKLW